MFLLAVAWVCLSFWVSWSHAMPSRVSLWLGNQISFWEGGALSPRSVHLCAVPIHAAADRRSGWFCLLASAGSAAVTTVCRELSWCCFLFLWKQTWSRTAGLHGNSMFHLGGATILLSLMAAWVCFPTHGAWGSSSPTLSSPPHLSRLASSHPNRCEGHVPASGCKRV